MDIVSRSVSGPQPQNCTECDLLRDVCTEHFVWKKWEEWLQILCLQAALLCQCMEVKDYTTAFKALQQASSAR